MKIDSTPSILVVGQTPPPWGGQAVMIQQLLEAPPLGVSLTHVRMAFSEDMDDVGRMRLGKLLHLVVLVVRILSAHFRYSSDILYYAPAGPRRVPVYRDFVILGLTRWTFRRTVFHFHASGLSLLYDHLNAIERWLFRRAYFHPDVAIQTSEANPLDGNFLMARHTVTVENGLPDMFPRFQILAYEERAAAHAPRILFLGALYRSKGVRVLVDAVIQLRDKGRVVSLECAGRFESPAFEKELRDVIHAAHMETDIQFPGVLTGDDKWRAYARADVFCFPSFFESESFGLVNLEAMMFELPVVSTSWRGIPTVVCDGQSGFLTPIQDSSALSERLGRLVDDPLLRRRMGVEGRRVYQNRFSLTRWRASMAESFAMLSRESQVYPG